MSDTQKRLLAYAVLVVAVLVAGFLGVSYPLPEPPMAAVVVDEEGFLSPAITKFRSILVDHVATLNTVNTTGAMDFDSTLNVDGASTLASVTVSGASAFNGGITADTNKFTVADTTGNTLIAGSLAANGGITADTDKFTVADATGNTVVAGTFAANGGITVDSTAFVVADTTGATTIAGLLSPDGGIDVDSVFTVADATGAIVAPVNVEHVGLPTIASASVVSSTTDGALFTIADGEIWLVHNVWVNVTTNFDCDADCTLILGDDLDTDGLCLLADAELQAADTEATGFAAGWQCMAAATRGVYLDEVTTNAYTGGFIYAPSGAAQTIDVDVGGTNLAAGEATVYVLYTRIQ